MSMFGCHPPLGLVLLGVMLGPIALAAQEPRLEGRLADAIRVEVDRQLDLARSAGLPTEPLVDRALEGAAKGAPGELIVRAVERLRAELQVARDALGVEASPAEMKSGASALRAGATADDLTELRRRRPDQSLTVAAGVLADLVAVGVPADTAIAAVIALAPVMDDGQYIAFRRNVERDIQLGASPAEALAVRLEAAGDALAPSDLSHQPSTPRKRKP